jgi:glycosyltransferase involved in cell wall biosynthesis
MKSILIYYPFSLTEKANSGSKVRPKKILEAFNQFASSKGFDIYVITGTSRERSDQFESLLQEGKLDRLMYCYVEDQTIPLWLTDPGHKPQKPFIDRKIFKFLKEKDVSIGIFYRDVYWKFDELYPLKGIKKAIMKKIYRWEEKFYEKYGTIMFLPSDAMGKYVDINLPKVALPPGGEDHDIQLGTKKMNGLKNGIYVGGINNEAYGLPLLLKSLKKINQATQRVNLVVVCRKEELEHIDGELKKDMEEQNVKVLHLSGEKLNQEYLNCDFAFIPRYKTIYNDFSVPVKLVEYLSNGLPIVATNCDAQANFINTGEYGVICKDETDSMEQAIEAMIMNSDKYRENIRSTFSDKHSWNSRVEHIHELLTKETV